MESFKEWLEARTYRDQQRLRTVYHWDTESDFYKVLQKQGRNFLSKRGKRAERSGNTFPGFRQEPRVYALWVSPNADWNDHWAAWMVRGNYNSKSTFYLHKIGMPEELYQKCLNFERPNWDEEGQAVPELVIMQKDWESLVPLGVQAFSRKELLDKTQANMVRRNTHGKETIVPGPTKNQAYHQGLRDLMGPDYEPDERIKPRQKAWQRQLNQDE
jgi:hypothetical protein